MAKAGVQPGPSVQLSEAQRSLLETRVKAERDNGVAALLQEILDRDKHILGELNAKVASPARTCRSPRWPARRTTTSPWPVRIKGRGWGEDKAKELAARANLMEELQPGWQVYHQDVDGTYLTTVTQGRATVGPAEYVRTQRVALERDKEDTMLIARPRRLGAEPGGPAAGRRKWTPCARRPHSSPR